MILSAIRSERFVGRREELAFLHEEFVAACAGRARFVPIEGEAGIGKSRLVAEFVASLGTQATVSHGQCSEHVRSPYLPFTAILPTRERGEKKGVFFEHALQWLERESMKRPVVAVIDDLQWADSATLELLRYLIAHLRPACVLLVAIFRTDAATENAAISAFRLDALRNRCNILQMHGLRRNDIRNLVYSIVRDGGAAVAPEAASQIELLSEGNPLFVEELVRIALDSGRLGLQSRVPVSIQAMLNERLARLGVRERDILVRAAIVGQRFDAAFLSNVAYEPLDAVLAAMQRAVEAGIVIASRTSPYEFVFRHALIRQTLADHLILGLAAPLHLRIAEELQALPDCAERVAELAFHWSAARVPDRARYYNERAAEAAVALYAYRDAIGFYSAALRWDYPPGPQRAAVYEKLGTLLYIDGCGNEPVAWFERCREEYAAIGDKAGVGHALVLLADQYWVDARTAESLHAASMAAQIVQPFGDSAMSAEALLALARFSITLGDAPAAKAHLETVEPLLTSCDVRLRANFHEIGAETYAALGYAKKALMECALASEFARASGISELIAQIENNYALVAADLGELAVAIERHKLALAEAHRTSMMWRVAYSALNYAKTLMLKGDLHDARRLVATAMESGVTTATFKTKAASVGIPLALLLNDRELLAACADESALAFACASGEPQRIASVYSAYAELHFSQAELARGSALLSQALRGIARLHRGWQLPAQVGGHGSSDDRRRARALLAGSTERPRVLRAHRLLFEAAAASGSNIKRSERLANLAARAFAGLGFALYEARALELAGRRAGAAALYARTGSIRDVERIKAAASCRTEAAIPLSARQLEIARLVADGESNKAIATRLHISENTVEHHLSGIFTRLGLKSRSQLAARIVALSYAT
ncbi:MAG: LuxR C-terminal-related transcriptional regulator [Candidatus Eremiobacteraeota bacterium]|nr:LuxR C-terminal-related transcriptional regulator [Candidatus Eremiobacteraeota bacterium]